MPAITFTQQAIENPRQLVWWQWGHVIGLWLGLLVVALAISGVHCPALLFAAAGHLAGDYTLQNGWMSSGKAKRALWPLVCHALIAGALTGMPFGAAGILVAVVTHLAIDATNKFGLGSNGAAGPIADQAAHIAIVLAMAVIL